MDDRAVSPLVAIVLIIAVTLMLVALVGSSLTSFGENATDAAPQASLSVTLSVSADEVTISHDGGDDLLAQTTRVTITIDGSESSWSEVDGRDKLTVGDTVTFDFSGTSDTGPTSGPWSAYDADDGSSDDAITTGDEVVVEIIDTVSQRIIFETRRTA
jgi:flagellin-like protein